HNKVPRSIAFALAALTWLADDAHADLRSRVHASGFTSPVAVVQEPMDRSVRALHGRCRRDSTSFDNAADHAGSVQLPIMHALVLHFTNTSCVRGPIRSPAGPISAIAPTLCSST